MDRYGLSYSGPDTPPPTFISDLQISRPSSRSFPPPPPPPLPLPSPSALVVPETRNAPRPVYPLSSGDIIRLHSRRGRSIVGRALSRPFDTGDTVATARTRHRNGSRDQSIVRFDKSDREPPATARGVLVFFERDRMLILTGSLAGAR